MKKQSPMAFAFVFLAELSPRNGFKYLPASRRLHFVLPAFFAARKLWTGIHSYSAENEITYLEKNETIKKETVTKRSLSRK